MRLLGNIIWLVMGGILIAIEYIIGSLILILTIIGIPFGLQTLKLATLALWPFGKKITQEPTSSGCLLTCMNILWLICGGLWISLTHMLFGVLLTITIIGIPFAQQHFKLATLALTPFGKNIS